MTAHATALPLAGENKAAAVIGPTSPQTESDPQVCRCRRQAQDKRHDRDCGACGWAIHCASQVKAASAGMHKG